MSDDDIIKEMKSIVGRYGEEIYDDMWREIILLVRDPVEFMKPLVIEGFDQ